MLAWLLVVGMMVPLAEPAGLTRVRGELPPVWGSALRVEGASASQALAFTANVYNESFLMNAGADREGVAVELLHVHPRYGFAKLVEALGLTATAYPPARRGPKKPDMAKLASKLDRPDRYPKELAPSARPPRYPKQLLITVDAKPIAYEVKGRGAAAGTTRIDRMRVGETFAELAAEATRLSGTPQIPHRAATQRLTYSVQQFPILSLVEASAEFLGFEWRCFGGVRGACAIVPIGSDPTIYKVRGDKAVPSRLRTMKPKVGLELDGVSPADLARLLRAADKRLELFGLGTTPIVASVPLGRQRLSEVLPAIAAAHDLVLLQRKEGVVLSIKRLAMGPIDEPPATEPVGAAKKVVGVLDLGGKKGFALGDNGAVLTLGDELAGCRIDAIRELKVELDCGEGKEAPILSVIPKAKPAGAAAWSGNPKLLATLVDPWRRQALLVDGSGTPAVVTQGGKTPGGRVVDWVSTLSVVLRGEDGQASELRLGR